MAKASKVSVDDFFLLVPLKQYRSLSRQDGIVGYLTARNIMVISAGTDSTITARGSITHVRHWFRKAARVYTVEQVRPLDRLRKQEPDLANAIEVFRLFVEQQKDAARSRTTAQSRS